MLIRHPAAQALSALSVTALWTLFQRYSRASAVTSRRRQQLPLHQRRPPPSPRQQLPPDQQQRRPSPAYPTAITRHISVSVSAQHPRRLVPSARARWFRLASIAAAVPSCHLQSTTVATLQRPQPSTPTPLAWSPAEEAALWEALLAAAQAAQAAVSLAAQLQPPSRVTRAHASAETWVYRLENSA